MNAAEAAAVLGEGVRDGKSWLYRCPVCGKDKLKLTDNPVPGKAPLLVYCWNCGKKKLAQIKAALEARGVLKGTGKGNGAAPIETDEQRTAREAAEAAERVKKINNAKDIWLQTVPADDGPAAT